MSLINRMLQDLDQRQALGGAEAGAVKVAPAKPAGREWFWRVLVVLLTGALAWLGWVAIQLMPRKPLATDLAYVAAGEAKRKAEKPAVAAEPKIAPEPLKLATELQAPPPPAEKVVVIVRPEAEAHYRRAITFLEQGRVSEAEYQLHAALSVDARHAVARQAYIALLDEQQRVSAARRLLQEGLALDPAQPQFALALARIYAGERDYPTALLVLDRVGAAAKDSEFQAFRGAMLQRLGRHEEAIAVYQNAVQAGTPPATAWIGYGMSLEATGRKSDAAQAYRRALKVGPLASEARQYAETRARALEQP